MSVIGLLDSRITVYRVDDGSVNLTNSLGEAGPEAGPKPVLLQESIKASLQQPRLRSLDDGPGDRSAGTMVLFVEHKCEIRNGDIVYIDKGPFRDTWWMVKQIPFNPSRGDHREASVEAYIGLRPD